MVAVKLLAEGVGRGGRHGGELAECLGGSGRAVELEPTDARKAGQIGDDRVAQLIKQVVEGRACIGFDQKGFDGFEALQETVGQLDPVEGFSHVSFGLCRWKE